jgi:hypothetical protein
MTLSELLSGLYALSGIAACACYVPQIRRLMADAAARRAMSLATWGGWLVVGMVTVLYAGLVVGAREMVAVAGLNWLCQAVVFGLAVAQRVADRRAGRFHPAGWPQENSRLRHGAVNNS